MLRIVLATAALLTACGTPASQSAPKSAAASVSGRITLTNGDAANVIDAMRDGGYNGRDSGGSRTYEASSIDCSVPVVLNPQAICTIRLADGRILNPRGNNAKYVFDTLNRSGGHVDSQGRVGVDAVAADAVVCVRANEPYATGTCTMFVNIRNN